MKERSPEDPDQKTKSARKERTDQNRKKEERERKDQNRRKEEKSRRKEEKSSQPNVNVEKENVASGKKVKDVKEARGKEVGEKREKGKWVNVNVEKGQEEIEGDDVGDILGNFCIRRLRTFLNLICVRGILIVWFGLICFEFSFLC